ncbi:MAG: hypothetical protein R6U84_04535, partial [Candidatus Cloacimonadales bacterium]
RKRRSGGTKLQYTDNEKTILEYLRKNQQITLPEFLKLASVTSLASPDILQLTNKKSNLQGAFSFCPPWRVNIVFYGHRQSLPAVEW